MDKHNPELGLTVLDGDWGATSLSAILGVLESVFDELSTVTGQLPDDRIEVSRWRRDYPLVVQGSRPYKIYLTASDTYWSQYVYQFSHELCHVLIRSDRFADHKHKWFEEALCEAASLFVLRRLVSAWAQAPPLSVLKAAEFAPSHGTYAERVERSYGVNQQTSLAEWFLDHREELACDRNNRGLNGVVAVALLGEFRKNTSLWRDCTALNSWDANQDDDFRAYLNSWSSNLAGSNASPRLPCVVARRLGVTGTIESPFDRA
ncbi:MAG: hypothetical protein OXJ37_12660 [Bryobacterales bacterium]|nr:hypothetical protein [Bryobacterales bacterium]